MTGFANPKWNMKSFKSFKSISLMVDVGHSAGIGSSCSLGTIKELKTFVTDSLTSKEKGT